MSSKVAYYYQLLWLYPLLGLSFFCAGFANLRVSEDASQMLPDRTSRFSSASVLGAGSGGAGVGIKLLDGLSRALVIVQCFALSFVMCA